MEGNAMIDVPEIIEQGEGKIVLELCKNYNISIKETNGTYRHLIDILSDLSSQIYTNE